MNLHSLLTIFFCCVALSVAPTAHAADSSTLLAASGEGKRRGDPREASADDGEALFQTFTRGSIALIERMIAWDGKGWDG